MEETQAFNDVSNKPYNNEPVKLLKQQINKVPFKDSSNETKKGNGSNEIKKDTTFYSEKEYFDCELDNFQCAKDNLCYCNGHSRKSIASVIHDLTPSSELINFLDVTSDPSKMFHLMINDPVIRELYNEKDPMKELREPFELPKLCIFEESLDLIPSPLPIIHPDESSLLEEEIQLPDEQNE